MGDRKIAAVTPTPQLETGRLSPVPSLYAANGETPRIPLRELDSGSLSQRLFHNPASASKTSPSSLLYTQMPHSAAQPAQGGRQWNYRAEQELAELRRQMELLNSLVIQQNVSCAASRADADTDELHRVVEELTEEKDGLCQLLKEKEEELGEVKQRLAQLQAEYIRDVRQIKSQALALTEEVSSREAAHRALEQEHRKSLKCINGLKAYIESLPAVDEVRELKADLSAKAAQCRDANTLVAQLEASLKEVRASLKSEQDENLRLHVELKETRDKNAALSGQARETERLRYEARNLDEDDVDNVLVDLAELRLEADRLRSLAAWKEARFEAAKQQLEEQVRRLSGLLEEANVQLRERSAGLRESEAGRRSLESQMAACRAEADKVRERLEEAEQEVRSLQDRDKIGQEIGGVYSRISSCLQACLKELTLLMDTSEEIIKGKDPNLSVLLGVRDTSILQSPPPAYSSLSSQQRLELARSQLQSARTILATVRAMRENLGEQYADRLADNMTSCVTQ